MSADAPQPEGGFLDEPDSYDKFEEGACPTCGADVGIAACFWWCDRGHFGHLEAA